MSATAIEPVEVIEVEPVEVERTCRTCGESKPLSAFTLSRGRPTYMCRECNRLRKRVLRVRGPEREVSADGATVIEPVEVPDPEPARELARQLVEHRRLGVRFDAIWPHVLEQAVAAVAAPRKRLAAERREWRAALESTRGAWRSAYSGDGSRMLLSPELAADEPGERHVDDELFLLAPITRTEYPSARRHRGDVSDD